MPFEYDEYNIVGEDLNTDKEAEVIDRIEKERRRSMEDKDYEYEKTKDQFKFIEYVNDRLRKELQELGVDRDFYISPEQIHFYPQDIFRLKLDKWYMCSRGCFDPIKQEININRDISRNELKLYKTILHEIIHAFSFTQFGVEEDKSAPFVSRLGYAETFVKDSVKHHRFWSFNDMITDMMAKKIIEKDRKELGKKFKHLDWDKISETEAVYAEILEAIIQKIAKVDNDDPNNVFDRFEKEILSGEMTFLQEIERVFGENFLRVLDAINFFDEEKTRARKYKRILEYFTTNIEEEKDKIVYELLSSSEEK